jgi:hypothetical protein
MCCAYDVSRWNTCSILTKVTASRARQTGETILCACVCMQVRNAYESFDLILLCASTCAHFQSIFAPLPQISFPIRVDFYYRAEIFLAKYCKGKVGPEEPDQVRIAEKCVCMACLILVRSSINL